MSFQNPDFHVAPALLLRRIEAELTVCRSVLGKIEVAVETLLKSGNVAQDDPLHIFEMQNIDLLDQTLADLVLCLQDIASAPSLGTAQPVRLAHMTRRMRLASLRERLSGHATTTERGDAVELF